MNCCSSLLSVGGALFRLARQPHHVATLVALYRTTRLAVREFGDNNRAARVRGSEAVKIRLNIAGNALTATLIDSETTRDFVSRCH